MVLQITKYQTRSGEHSKLSESLKRLKEFYLGHGCKYYEVIEDAYVDNSILEIKRFDSPELIEEIDIRDAETKKVLYDNFYRDNGIVEKSEEVKFV